MCRCVYAGLYQISWRFTYLCWNIPNIRLRRSSPSAGCRVQGNGRLDRSQDADGATLTIARPGGIGTITTFGVPAHRECAPRGTSPRDTSSSWDASGATELKRSRFNGLDFSSEVGPKSFHQLAHPSDELGSLHRFEQLRGKVVGLKMKDAIPTPTERIDIRGRQECVDPGINQLQIPEALNNDGQARVPIVHEVTAWAGEKFEGGEIRIL